MPLTSPGNDDGTGENHQPTLRKNTAEPAQQTLKQYTLRPENRDAGQADKPAVRRDRDAGDAEAPRRRVEEPELGNALMREVVKARRKRPKR